MRVFARALHIFVGVGALAGGVMALSGAAETFGIELKNAPFKTFLIPGLILFIVIGLGNLCAALLIKKKLGGYLSALLGVIMVIWIAVQCVMLWAFTPLHGIFLAIGTGQTALASVLLSRGEMPPWGNIRRLWE
ncbi:hypothetical protein FACS1894202_12470 [Clostridia bacterium]|nr:hypothetical protein FACS1894202_12470 [Clostridia bacterium]